MVEAQKASEGNHDAVIAKFLTNRKMAQNSAADGHSRRSPNNSPCDTQRHGPRGARHNTVLLSRRRIQIFTAGATGAGPRVTYLLIQPPLASLGQCLMFVGLLLFP